jgi:hypothetical protein
MINVGWADFKSICASRAIGMQYVELETSYHLWAFDGPFEVSCHLEKDSGADQAEFEADYKAGANASPKVPVQTQFERQDIVLKLAKGTAEFDLSGEAEISLLVPGTPGSGDGRYVAGGYAFTDVFGFGDYVEKVCVVDVDNLLGMGAEAIIQTYHDTDVPGDNQGWYFWPSPQVGGEAEIDPMGYYGFIPSGLYLEIYFKKAPGSAAQNVYCNVWWGKHYD